MSVDHDKLLFEHLGNAWLHYVSWRERIFAGYLTVLAALAYGFSQETVSNPVRAAVFAFSIVVSTVFRILDIRTTGYVNMCQKVGRNLAPNIGLYAELDKDRFADKGKDLLRRATFYGFAINLLVAGVIGPSAVGFAFYIWKWRHADYVLRSWWWPVSALASVILVLITIECCTSTIWKREKDEYESSP